jgi:hypothetical protein
MVISNSHFLKWEPRKELKSGNIALTYLRSNKKGESKLHPIQKSSKKSSSSQQLKEER